jgi:hypothetical protein
MLNQSSQAAVYLRIFFALIKFVLTSVSDFSEVAKYVSLLMPY